MPEKLLDADAKLRAIVRTQKHEGRVRLLTDVRIVLGGETVAFRKLPIAGRANADYAMKDFHQNGSNPKFYTRMRGWKTATLLNLLPAAA